MQFLSHEKCDAWLATRGVFAHPYGTPLLPGVCYTQFMVPKPRPSGRKLMDGILSAIRPRSATLFRVEDWSRFEEEFGNEELARLGGAFPEALITWEARVGVVFEEIEAEQLSACCAQVIDQGMSAYLYIPRVATLLLWEGDLVDFWSEERAVARSFMAWVQKEGLAVTSE